MEDKAPSDSRFNYKQPAATKALHNHHHEEMNLTDNGSNWENKTDMALNLTIYMGSEFPFQRNPCGTKDFAKFYSLNKIANPKLRDEQLN